MNTKVFADQGMKVQRINVTGWENAIYGMRLPMNSEAQSDSTINLYHEFLLGDKDKNLMIRLAKAGTDHSKVLRMIHVSALVKMPLSWWKQYDTYKISTTAISRSTMHRGIGGQKLTKNDFFVLAPDFFNYSIIDSLNKLQEQMKATEDQEQKRIIWERIIDLIPTSYCQERMLDLNYQVLLNILGSRYQVEKLDKPWNFFCESFLHTCPHLQDLYDAVKHKRSLTTEEFKQQEVK